MINLLSYVGMNLQAELCMWTLLGLLRTIFDATLFKVNANLKQVWQMSMPAELSMPVQRALRTMISGVMLVQCFTVYVYLASYIVLLYPVFLEERPTLVLPWLLLAAIRKFLCELTSLALGLGACVLLGPARPPCIKFVITKIASITPTFYLWMLVFSYYNTLKVTAAFKTFPAVLQSSDHDYGLELAVRRRRTKSLQDEEQLRKKLVASFYEPNHHTTTVVETPPTSLKTDILISSRTLETIVVEDIKPEIYVFRPFSVISERLMSNLGTYEDWCGNEVTLPRDTDRILEQFVLMLLRISAYMKSDATDPAKLFSSSSPLKLPYGSLDCTTLPNEDTEPPPQVGNSKGRTASYLQEYPQIFNKKASESLQHTPEQLLGTSHSVANHNEINNIVGALRSNKQDSTAVKMLSPEPAAVINLKNVSVPKIADKKNKKMALQDIEENETFKQKSGSGIKDVDIKLTIETQAVIDVYNSEDNLITPKVGKHDFLNDSKCKEIEMKTDENIVNVNDDIKDNASISVSVDSIQSIIDRMKDSLSQNKKFSDKDKNKYETNGPSSSHLPKDRI